MRKFVTFNVGQILGQYSNSEENYIVQSCDMQEVNSYTYPVLSGNLKRMHHTRDISAV